jgi:hypothetical protein
VKGSNDIIAAAEQVDDFMEFVRVAFAVVFVGRLEKGVVVLPCGEEFR